MSHYQPSPTGLSQVTSLVQSRLLLHEWDSDVQAIIAMTVVMPQNPLNTYAYTSLCIYVPHEFLAAELVLGLKCSI